MNINQYFKYMRSSKVILVLGILFVCAGCYHARILTGKKPSRRTIEKKFAASFLYGLVPPKITRTARRCPHGVSRIDTKISFLNYLTSFVTASIFTPMYIKVRCAQQPPNMAAQKSTSNNSTISEQNKEKKTQPTKSIPKKLIKPGNGGKDVKWVQQTLNNLGYSCGKEDSIIGPSTKSCIRAFQKNHKLLQTGKVNDITYKQMLKQIGFYEKQAKRKRQRQEYLEKKNSNNRSTKTSTSSKEGAKTETQKDYNNQSNSIFGDNPNADSKQGTINVGAQLLFGTGISSITYPFPKNNLGLGVNAFYNATTKIRTGIVIGYYLPKKKNINYSSNQSIPLKSSSVFSISLDGQYLFFDNESINAYGMAGLTYQHYKLKIESSSSNYLNSRTGSITLFNIGAGIEYQQDFGNIFGELRYDYANQAVLNVGLRLQI